MPRFLASAARHQHHGGGAVVDARGVAGGDGAGLVEGRAQLRQAVEGGAVADVLVLGDDGVALLALDGDGDDLVLELAGLLGGLGLVLRGDGELVLILARDLPLARDVLGRGAHVVAVEGVPQAVLDHGVDEVEAAHLGAVAQVRGVLRLAHALLAAGDDDGGGARLDLLGAEGNGAQAGAAHLVDAPGRAIDRDAGGDRRLASRVLALAGREHLAEDDLGDVAGLDAGALDSRLDGDLSELVAGQARQRAVERADRRPRCAGNDDGGCRRSSGGASSSACFSESRSLAAQLEPRRRTPAGHAVNGVLPKLKLHAS